MLMEGNPIFLSRSERNMVEWVRGVGVQRLEEWSELAKICCEGKVGL